MAELMHLEGTAELLTQFRELREAAQKRALRAAAKDGAEVIRAEAARLAPRARGKLAQHIETRVHAMAGPNEIDIDIGPAKNVWYGMIVELGAKPHRMRPRRSRGKKVLASMEQVFGAEIEHPGFRARPFLRPAFDTQKEAAVEAFGQSLQKRVTRALARQRKRG